MNALADNIRIGDAFGLGLLDNRQHSFLKTFGPRRINGMNRNPNRFDNHASVTVVAVVRLGVTPEPQTIEGEIAPL